MKTYKMILFLMSFLMFAEAYAAAKPLALVWSGDGACRPGCLIDAARMAKKAGFRVRYVNSKLKDFSVFDQAKLWVQPGGKSVKAAADMGPKIMQAIVDFVAKGGGYVGFCAGAFISTSKIGTSGKTGFGLIPGETELLPGPEVRMLRLSTSDFGKRWMIFLGGPHIKISESELASINGEIIATYPDGNIAGVRGHYGKGKVAVIGTHPEADVFWKLYHLKVDPDGSDAFYAMDMIKYATSPQ